MVVMDIVLQVLIIVALGFVGAAMGSFAGAQVWRIRAQQLKQEKSEGEKVDEKEYKRLKPLINNKGLNDRSIDLDTGKRLPWYDLIPIFSWLALKGKSRYSKKPIGKFEFFIEAGVALFFIVSYVVWPVELSSFFEISRFVLWLVSGVVLAVLFSYDYKWYLLPNNYTIALAVFGALNFLMVIASSDDKIAVLLNSLASILILSGLYLAFYLYSKGKWVGFGDVKLGFGLALFLISWQLSFLALFLANLLGILVVLPSMIKGELEKGSKIPLGPLLILGMIISFLFGNQIIDGYLSLML